VGEKENAMLRIYDVILEVIRELRPFVRALERVNAGLAGQMKDAMTSMALNCAEGSGSRGGNRTARYGNACGSAKETRSCVDCGIALHDMKQPNESTMEKLRHVIGALTLLSR
jgi:four helix bundle protein